MLLCSGAQSGRTLQPSSMPPLRWVATYPLVESLQSRLTVLTKRPIGS